MKFRIQIFERVKRKMNKINLDIMNPEDSDLRKQVGRHSERGLKHVKVEKAYTTYGAIESNQ